MNVHVLKEAAKSQYANQIRSTLYKYDSIKKNRAINIC